MTRGTLKQLIAAIVGDEPSNTAAVTDWRVANDIVDTRLSSFSSQTLCRYNQAIPLTLVVGQSDYGMASSAFAADMVRVVDVTVDGRVLSDFDGNHGPVGMDRLTEVYPGWQTTPNGMPRHWVDLSVNRRIILYPAPDQVYGDTFAAGFLRIPVMANALTDTIDSSLVADATVIDVPESLREALVHWVAAGFVNMAVRPELYDRLVGMAEARMREHRAEMLSRFSRTQRRGGTDDWCRRIRV